MHARAKGDERRVIHEVLEWQETDIFRVVSREKGEEKQAGSRACRDRQMENVKFLPSSQQPHMCSTVHCWNFRTIHGGYRSRVGIGLAYRPARLHRLVKSVPWNRFLAPSKFKNTVFVYSTVYTPGVSWNKKKERRP